MQALISSTRFVGQDFRRQVHGDAVGPPGPAAAGVMGSVTGSLRCGRRPSVSLRRLLVEDHVEANFEKTRLDITARGGLVAREDIAPVALTVDQQVLSAPAAPARP